MGAEPKMRMPYGPGWEDPDWDAYGVPPDESGAMKLAAAADEPPVVSTLGEFMALVRRVALPRAARADRLFAGRMRRRMMAGGAGLMALATLPATARPRDAADTCANTPADAPQACVEGTPRAPASWPLRWPPR